MTIPLAVYQAESFLEKTKGLIGVKKIYPLLLQTRWGIHTFGMRESLDIVVLNNKNQVVYLKERLLPNRVLFWNPSFSLVLELPPKTIKDKKIHQGTYLALRILSRKKVLANKMKFPLL